MHAIPPALRLLACSALCAFAASPLPSRCAPAAAAPAAASSPASPAERVPGAGAGGDSLSEVALRRVVALLAAHEPEAWTRAGVGGFEAETIDPSPAASARFRAEAVALSAELAAARDAAADPDERLDLELLRWDLRLRAAASEVEEREQIPWLPAATFAAEGVLDLLRRGAPELREAAVARLRAYAGLGASPSLTARLQEGAAAALDGSGGAGLPCRARLEAELAAGGPALDALEAGLREAGLRAALPALAALRAQWTAHAAFVRERLLPRAPERELLSARAYTSRLARLGVAPEAASAARAQETLRAARAELAAEAARFAEQAGWPEREPLQVLARLGPMEPPSPRAVDLHARRVAAGQRPARAIFGSRSAAEGWAVYAEWLARQALPAADRLAALRFDALRAARAVLDREVNTGARSPEEAVAFLMTELGLSRTLARDEVARFVAEPGAAAVAMAGALDWLALGRAAADAGVPAAAFHRLATALADLPAPLAAAGLRGALERGEAGAAAPRA